MIGWSFPPNNHGIAAGPNDGAVDAFAGTRLSSVVREIIQNSLDARKSEDEPVRLNFSIDEVDKKAFSGFAAIKPHLQACKKEAKLQELGDAVKIYEHGIKEIEKNDKVRVLSVHDHNTNGLEGAIAGPDGSWYALLKGAGLSQKSASGSLGSFGHGSKAPFSYSPTRTIFYYSRIKGGERFQGKSILQTHSDPNDAEVKTQGTGFYGHVDKLEPLTNDEIPNWAKELREKVTKDTGTSIYIPYAEYNESLYPETRITVIANFFYAIRAGALEVTIGDEAITKENLEECFIHCEKILKDEQDEIDVPHIEDCFKSINTIIFPDHNGGQEVTNFGHFTWFLRIDDELEKKVGLARSSGMLITRKPPQLAVFPNVKSFDMFICVDSSKGSELLKSLENPTHDNFEFDRIKVPEDKKEAKRKYNAFQKCVREIINRHAQLDSDSEEEVTDLGFLFSGVSDIESNVGKTERGRQLYISDGSPKKRPPSIPPSQSGSESPTIDLGCGNRDGDGSIEKSGGEIPDPEGTPINGTEQGDGASKGKEYVAKNFRAVHSKSEKNKATLYFDSPVSGVCFFVVSIVGENGTEPVKLIIDGTPASGINLDLLQAKRHKLEVEFASSVEDYALEASLTEQVASS